MPRNETQPIAFAPKIEPAKTSWWTELNDRTAWYQRAAEEAARMRGSREAKGISGMKIIGI